ncbi:MAG: hypothetical protein ACKOLA_09785 [Spartobacteria bacterium]
MKDKGPRMTRINANEEVCSTPRAGRGWRRTNHGLLGWTRMIPASWDWQKKSKNLASPLAEFSLWFCPIRAANAAVPTQSPGGFSVREWFFDNGAFAPEVWADTAVSPPCIRGHLPPFAGKISGFRPQISGFSSPQKYSRNFR